MTTNSKKTTRVAKRLRDYDSYDKVWEIYNRVNLQAVTEPMTEFRARGVLSDLFLDIIHMFPEPEHRGNMVFPYAIREVWNKGRRIGAKDLGLWIDRWREKEKEFEEHHEEWTSEKVAEYVRLRDMSGVD